MSEYFPTPEEVAALELRELAAKVQMDQTPPLHHDAAVAWSVFTLERATRPEVRAADPTLAGEVYRNRALRLELMGAPVKDVDDAVRASLTEFVDPTNIKVTRERAATLSVLGSLPLT